MKKINTIIVLFLLLTVTSIIGLYAKDEVVVTGAVEDFSANHVKVDGQVFAIFGGTKFKDGSSDNLAVGTIVSVSGKVIAKQLTAMEITFAADTGGSSVVVVEGLVTSIRGKTIAVGDTNFQIDNKNRALHNQVKKLGVGMMVSVTAEVQGDGSYLATAVDIIDSIAAASKGKGNTTFTDVGVLTDLEPADSPLLLLTLDGSRQYLTDESNKLQGRDGLECTAADMVVGMTIRVKFKANPTNSSDPTEVFSLEVVGNETIKGRIQPDNSPAGSLPSITANGKSIYYDSCTELVGAKGGVTDPSDLKNGTAVFIKAVPLADGTYLANRIVASNSSLAEGEAVSERGIVSSLVKSNKDELKTFVVNDRTFSVTSTTEFGVDNYAGTFPQSDFVAGLDVLAEGEAFGDKIFANSVTVFLPSYDYSGAIEEIGADYLVVAGLKFSINEYTAFSEFGYTATLTDMSVGDPLVITAIEWPDGSMIASDVAPGEGDPPGDTGGVEISGMILQRYINDATGNPNLLVGDVWVEMTYDTTITDASGAPGSFLNLTVGKTIKVIGNYNDAGLFVADSIVIL